MFSQSGYVRKVSLEISQETRLLAQIPTEIKKETLSILIEFQLIFQLNYAELFLFNLNSDISNISTYISEDIFFRKPALIVLQKIYFDIFAI